MHENIERSVYLIRFDLVGMECCSQVAETPAMGLGVTIDDAEHLRTARRQRKIMSPNRILDDFQHHIAAIGIQRMPLGQEKR